MSDVGEVIDSGDGAEPGEENANSPLVLVVEDEDNIFRLIEAFAEFISVRCRLAKTDAEIAEALSSEEISVVISDLRLLGVADPIATV